MLLFAHSAEHNLLLAAGLMWTHGAYRSVSGACVTSLAIMLAVRLVGIVTAVANRRPRVPEFACRCCSLHSKLRIYRGANIMTTTVTRPATCSPIKPDAQDAFSIQTCRRATATVSGTSVVGHQWS